jgi:toxin CptA
MSIAVSAVVKPSRRLSVAVVAMCMAVLCSGMAIGLGVVGDLTPVFRMGAVLVCVAGAGYAFCTTVMTRKMYDIHISGVGQIRLSVQATSSSRSINRAEKIPAEPVRLLASSTLWSGLLILHLQNEKKRTEVVRILPDSVSTESFRALLVACRWIVMRHPEAENRYEHHN